MEQEIEQTPASSTIILRTKRLVLRKLESEDFEDVCKLLQDPVVMYAYEGAFSAQEVRDWMEKQFRRYREDGFGLWGVMKKDKGELIGQCGLTYQEYAGRRVVEIGYLFRKEFWHQGYATEAAVACKTYAFDVLGCDEVYSIIRDTNIASQKVARRNGMEKVDAFIKHYRNIEMPHLVFSVKNDWSAGERKNSADSARSFL